MLAVSILALVLALFSAIFCVVTRSEMKAYRQAIAQSLVPQSKADLPAYARNYNPDGPSGHAFQGHPHTLKHPGSKS